LLELYQRLASQLVVKELALVVILDGVEKNKYIVLKKLKK
jgi:hypothetical protein